MTVYLIQIGDDGPVKIGSSTDPRRRRSELQAAHWDRLRIVRCWIGGRKEEQFLHERFAAHWRRGDWFNFHADMLGQVGLIEMPVPRDAKMMARANAGSALARYLATNGVTIAEFAKELHVSVQAVHRYISGDRLPRTFTMGRIMKMTKGAVSPNDFYAERKAAA